MDYDNELEHFSLRWNNFNDNMKSGFHDLLRREDFVDVTIAAEGKLIQAHKMVLSVCSPYFKNIFKTNPCQHPIVFLKDVSHKELSGILQFMYLGEVSVQQEELGRFLKTAEALQIKGLTGEDNEDKNVELPNIPKENNTGMKTKLRKCMDNDPPDKTIPSKKAKFSSSPYSTKVSYKVKEDIEIVPKTEPADSVISETDQCREDADPLTSLLNATSQVVDDSDMIPQTVTTTALGSGLFSGVSSLTSEPFTITDNNQGLRYFPILTKNQGICPVCGRILQHKKNLQTHIADQHSGIFRCWPCEICHKVCKTWSALRVHTNRHHTKLGAGPLLDLRHQVN